MVNHLSEKMAQHGGLLKIIITVVLQNARYLSYQLT